MLDADCSPTLVTYRDRADGMMAFLASMPNADGHGLDFGDESAAVLDA